MRRAKGILLAAALMSAIGAPTAGIAAGEAPDAGPAESAAIPAYSVARLKINEGIVRVREGDSGDWVEYTSNMPVAGNSRLSVPAGSDAELQFHGEQFVLLAGGTEVVVREMNKDRTVFGLVSGELRFDLSSKDDFGAVEVLVPGDARVRFDAPGRAWVNIGQDGAARLVVRRGDGIVTAASGEHRVKEGEEASIGREVRIAEYSGAPEPESPETPLSEAETEAGVPPSAAQELRDYGDWVYAPDYGYVWRPRVAVGWSPYYYGRWSWVAPWGWTWVAYEPWGWWPYHYGWWWNDPFFGWVWCPFRTFASVQFSFRFGHSRFYCNNVFFRPATVRFVSEGGRVRWTPLRPGVRIVERPPFRRGDARLTRWDRPIGRETVFVRQRDAGANRWGDWATQHRARVSSVPRGIAVGSDGRVLGRQELRQGRGGRDGAPRAMPGRGEIRRPDFDRGGTDRVGGPRGTAPRSGGLRGEGPATRDYPGRTQERVGPLRQNRSPAGDRPQAGGWGARRNDAPSPGRSFEGMQTPRGREGYAPPPRESFVPPAREGFSPPQREGFSPPGRGGFDPPGRGDFGGRGGGRDFGDGNRGGGRR